MTTSHRGSSQTAPGRGPYIGRPMPRYEDLRLVRGQGRYTDDLSLPGQGIAVFVRAPHAHARILRIDTTAARALPGVVAVLTGQDYVDDGFVGMPHFPNPAGAIDIKVPSFTSTPECAILDEPQLPFAVDLVRFVGEAVAIVVAESLPAARDAAEAVVVEYEALPAVTDVFEALAPGAPAIWPQAPGNLALDNAFGDRAAVDAAHGQGPSGGRADHPLPAHRQRLHGAALGDRRLRCGGEEIHPDVRLPGRASHPRIRSPSA